MIYLFDVQAITFFENLELIQDTVVKSMDFETLLMPVDRLSSCGTQ